MPEKMKSLNSNIRHNSKAVFAKGAVEAGKFLKGKGAGLYDMSDVIQFLKTVLKKGKNSQ